MKSAFLVSLLLLAAGAGCSRAAETPAVAPLPSRPPRTIAPAEAAQRVADGKAVLIDVREPKEWAETGVAAPAALLPLSDLNGDRKQWKEFLEKNRDKELILYCRSGSRSGRAAKLLAEEGYRTLNAGGFQRLAGRRSADAESGRATQVIRARGQGT
jgi:rhodanese-related sulfurtransferase